MLIYSAATEMSAHSCHKNPSRQEDSEHSRKCTHKNKALKRALYSLVALISFIFLASLALVQEDVQHLYKRQYYSNSGQNSFVRHKLWAIIVVVVGLVLLLVAGICVAACCCRESFKNPICCPCYTCACCGCLGLIECLSCGLCAEGITEVL